MRAVHVTIRGKVQGVGYREWTRRMAEQRGIYGWVRNRSDATVEALFSGTEDMVEAMLELCRKGPPTAYVTALEVMEAAAPLEREFKRLPTL